MKSIGIITIHNCQNNYGGSLQCFGLYKYLISLGYFVEVIDLHRPNHADYVDCIRFRTMRSNYGFCAFIKGYIKEFLGIRKLRNQNFKPTWNPIAGERFDNFNRRIKLSAPYCYIPDLYKNPPQYDVYITGSDQLWNPDQPYCLEPYFLTFVKNRKTLKISYGTSIGLSDLTDREKKIFAKWLCTYDKISVREQNACDMLRSLTKSAITKVPDPTFLLEPEEWLQISEKPKTEEVYVLIFSLGKEEGMIKKGIDIAKQKGCKVKVIEQNYNFLEHPIVEVIDDAGPLEFIGLIKSAWLVLTDSFHCTVFSLITGTRNFYTYIAPSNNRGIRIVELLITFGLSEHIIYSMDVIPSINLLNNIVIDVAESRKILKIEQQKGRDFLRKSLSIIK